MRAKIRVAILCGGRSAEHEISLISGMNITAALDHELYEPVVICVTKDGKWYLQDESTFLSGSRDPLQVRITRFSRPLGVIPGGGVGGQLVDLSTGKKQDPIDVVFPILHGPFGEDGSMQGLLKQLDVPFVGPGVLGSAMGMDKEVMKRLLNEAGIPNAKSLSYKKHEKEKIQFETVKATLGLPVFIKPANLGSSIGISKVEDESAFDEAIHKAFEYDEKLIIEEFVKGREIECAVLGNEEVIASVPGEIIPQNDFYSYEAKYLDDKGAILEAPARNLTPEMTEKIKQTSIKVFQLLECEGLSRVDFFLKENGELYLNEINTLPGFTRISMYPRLWELSGIDYPALLSRLIRLAMDRFGKERVLSTAKTV